MANNSPFVSIIIAVYNVESYIRRCLDSILAQTFVDFEVLLINDGSTDSSGDICDEYAAKDSRFRVFHKANGGVSSARNLGIDNATGIYSIHVDPDDYIATNMLDEMYKYIIDDDVDMLVVDYYLVSANSVVRKYQPCFTGNSIILLDYYLDGRHHGSMWNKLIKHEVFKKYNLSFDVNLHSYEDLLINCELAQKQIRVAYLDKAFYFYVQTSDSLTHNHYQVLKNGLLFLNKLYLKLEPIFMEKMSIAKIGFKVSLITNPEVSDTLFYSLFRNQSLMLWRLPYSLFKKILYFFVFCGGRKLFISVKNFLKK